METVITSGKGMLCFDLRRDLPLIMAAQHVTFATLIAFMDAWIIPLLPKGGPGFESDGWRQVCEHHHVWRVMR